jgi:hypothetical protein
MLYFRTLLSMLDLWCSTASQLSWLLPSARGAVTMRLPWLAHLMVTSLGREMGTCWVMSGTSGVCLCRGFHDMPWKAHHTMHMTTRACLAAEQTLCSW